MFPLPALVHNWFAYKPRFSDRYLSTYSPFLNPIGGFFSAWRWKVYDREPHDRVVLQAVEGRAMTSMQTRAAFPLCSVRGNTAWARRQDAVSFLVGSGSTNCTFLFWFFVGLQKPFFCQFSWIFYFMYYNKKYSKKKLFVTFLYLCTDYIVTSQR